MSLSSARPFVHPNEICYHPHMKADNIPAILKIVRQEYKRFRTPYVTEVAEELKRSPFKVLISCLVSLRTRDDVTREASQRLFRLADTPSAMLTLSIAKIERAIYPAGFYRTKARTIIEISKELVERRSSKVPDTIEGLLELKGVGRKTANLVLTLGFGKPGICVDTHVHRITNRWGLVETGTPAETEYALRETLPRRYWIIINDLLVAYGQNVCGPLSPLCSACPISRWCERRNVKRSR